MIEGTVHGQIYDDQAENVGQDVAQENAPVAGAEDAGGLDEGAAAQAQHLAADDARHREPGVPRPSAEEGGELEPLDGGVG